MKKKEIIISIIEGIWNGIELTSSVLWRAILGFGMLFLLDVNDWVLVSGVLIFSLMPLVNHIKHNLRFLKGE